MECRGRLGLVIELSPIQASTRSNGLSKDASREALFAFLASSSCVPKAASDVYWRFHQGLAAWTTLRCPDLVLRPCIAY